MISPLLYAGLLLALVGPSFTMSVMPPSLPLVAAYFGGGEHGEEVAQWAQSLPFLGLAIGGLLSGTVIARLGLRVSVISGAICFAGAGVVAGISTTGNMLIGACFAAGFAGSLLTTTLTTAGAAIMQGPSQARLLGLQTAASDLAAIGGGIFAAVLAQMFGWRAPLAIYVMFGLAVLASAGSSRLPEAPPREDIGNGIFAAARSAPSIFIAAFLTFASMGTLPSLLPFYLAAHGVETPGTRAVVLTATPVLSAVFSATYGRVAARMRGGALAAIAALASAVGYGVLATWQSGVLFAALGTGAIGVGIGLTFPALIRATFHRTPSTIHGYAMGLLNTAVFSGVFAAPLLFGPIMRSSSLSLVFVLLALGWLKAGLAIVWVNRSNASSASFSERPRAGGSFKKH
jgi:MFS family permease